jgi:hypothetical protein
MAKKTSTPAKLQPWLEARKRYHLTDTKIQMAGELGLFQRSWGAMPTTGKNPGSDLWVNILKQIAPRRWDYHFVLVRPDQIHTEEKKAILQAERDLDAAFSKKQRAGSDQAVAESLRPKGYLSVTGFKIAPE